MPKKTGDKNAKPKVGFYDLAGCNGCLLSVLFNEDEILDMVAHLDIRAFRFIKDVKDEKDFDIVFMEGLVASNDDLEMLKSVRSKTKILVALGTCACTGCIPAYRNFIDTSKYAHLVYEKVREISDQQPTPIDVHVEVDFRIPGCPPDKQQILDFIKDVLLGKKPQDWDRPVCFECRLNENRCLLDDGKMCLGPITRGGCDSICTNGNLECWGCRGPTPDADIDLLIKLLEEKGFAKEHIKQRLRTFAGMQIETPPPPKPIKIKKLKKPKKLKKAVKLKKAPKPMKLMAVKKKVKKAPKKKAKKPVKKKKAKKPDKNPLSNAGVRKTSRKPRSVKKKKAVKQKKTPRKKPVKKKAVKKKPAKSKAVKRKKPARKKVVKKTKISSKKAPSKKPVQKKKVSRLKTAFRRFKK
ncbi:hypothetical protein KY362_01825 [Candidatus Woesearchaeota archaeon]|nr:hypothetical protein [Candidatus Woesearchaeota archaeon]